MKAAALTAVTLVILAVFAGGAAGAPKSAETAAGARTITFVNHTDETIWVAATPGSLAGVTGWKLPAGGSRSIRVSGHYNARIWGRTGCHFNAQGRGHCQTGDCGGRFADGSDYESAARQVRRGARW